MRAIRQAGGVTRRADLTALNLAAPLQDGQQVVVPRRAAEGAGGAVASTRGASGGGGGGMVSLSSATAEQLETLDGIGPKRPRALSSGVTPTAASEPSTTSTTCPASARPEWRRSGPGSHCDSQRASGRWSGPPRPSSRGPVVRDGARIVHRVAPSGGGRCRRRGPRHRSRGVRHPAECRPGGRRARRRRSPSRCHVGCRPRRGDAMGTCPCHLPGERDPGRPADGGARVRGRRPDCGRRGGLADTDGRVALRPGAHVIVRAEMSRLSIWSRYPGPGGGSGSSCPLPRRPGVVEGPPRAAGIVAEMRSPALRVVGRRDGLSGVRDRVRERLRSTAVAGLSGDRAAVVRDGARRRPDDVAGARRTR